MSFEAAANGEYGSTLILPNATTTPETGNSWWCIEVLADMEVTAISGPNIDGTHGTKTWKAGSRFIGVVTSITCSNTQTGGLMVGVYRRATPT